jgi:hypothetical protein
LNANPKGFFVGIKSQRSLKSYCILIKKGGGIRSCEALATVQISNVMKKVLHPVRHIACLEKMSSKDLAKASFGLSERGFFIELNIK